MYDAPLAVYCWPFIESSSAFTPGACTGERHSSWDSSTKRASTGAAAPPKPQRSVYESLKPPPSTTTRVPPRSGPTDGDTPLASSSEW